MPKERMGVRDPKFHKEEFPCAQNGDACVLGFSWEDNCTDGLPAGIGLVNGNDLNRFTFNWETLERLHEITGEILKQRNG